MGPHLELKRELKIKIDISASKENGMVSQEPQEMTMQCASNYKVDNFDVKALLGGQVNVPNGREEMELDIMECTNSSDHGLVEAEDRDATENSSSFGDTVSGTENSSVFSDHEVESPLYGGNTLSSVFDGCGGVVKMRKKKLTDHWRRFIRPLMWRCKWIELQIKEFQFQALKYDRELAEYDQRKQFEFEKFTLQGYDTKSRPFSNHTQRKKVMKRKKRKRVEETADVASYMSHHNLFSYYGYRKSVADSALVDNNCGSLDQKPVNGNDEIGFNDEWSFLEFRDGDNKLEQILRKIEVAQSESRKLKSRIDKVVCENPGKFSSLKGFNWLAPYDALTCSDQNHVSPPENGDRMPVRSPYVSSQHVSEDNTGDFFMLESAVPSHGEVTPLPDMMIQSTEPPLVKVSSETLEQGILIHNQAAKEELDNFERVLTQLTGKPQVSMEKPSTISLTFRSSVPNKKRKRAMRKSGSSGWNTRSSG